MQFHPIKAWVFIGIINGLEEMFRIKIPVLDVFGGKDWEITQVGAYERGSRLRRSRDPIRSSFPDAQHSSRDGRRSGSKSWWSSWIADSWPATLRRLISSN